MNDAIKSYLDNRNIQLQFKAIKKTLIKIVNDTQQILWI